ncbi:MAG TPA: SOS response-associated peptidase [Pseudonocardia sp.]|nr:SOS response-associated peptidase [Pseudonocardia sp.]
MCGRYASTKAAADIASEFDAVDATDGAEPGADYNVAPTKPVLTVVQRHPRDADGVPDRDRSERSVRVMRWGLVPSWSKNATGGAKMINARSETAAQKPSFRKALATRRCLMPADGWYEWQRSTSAKQPYYLTGPDGASLAMAGLWEFWRSADGGEPLVTSAVLTTGAVGALSEIHDRMPLLLAREDWAAWLDPDSADVTPLLAQPSARIVDSLELRPISSRVNNVRNGGPELTARADPVRDLGELALDLG